MRTVKIIGVFLAIIVLFSFIPAGGIINSQLPAAPAAGNNSQVFAADSTGSQPLTIMKPTPAQKAKWLANYKKAPRIPIDTSAKSRLLTAPTGSKNLLSLLEYTPIQRNQGYCGNCWAWAGTGVMEIALNVQKGIRDRLSVQYLNSNFESGATACCGGWLGDVADFYSSTGITIPWSNTGASYADTYPPGCGSIIPASSIATDPHYNISSISEVVIPTQGLTESEAVANIKSVLDQDKAVWFAFFFPRGADWTFFRNFWNTEAESSIAGSPNPFDTAVGKSWDAGGGGHAVLCVGYYDDGVSNRYWLMVNSWGTTILRPNGLFKVPMYINYDAKASDGYPLYWWQTLNMTYGVTAEAPYIIGSEDLPADGTLNKDTLYFSRFQALQTGTAATWKLKASGPGNVKIAVYGDGAGVPYGRLYYQATPIPVVAGWNDISMSCPFIGGNYYWLAYISDANIVQRYITTGRSYLTSKDFSTYNFETGWYPYFTLYRNFIPLIACYGSVPEPPASAPALVSPGNSIIFKWAQVSGATNYRLQVNTNSSFTGADIFNAEVNNTIAREVFGFTDNVTYYWRVQAGNPYGWGPWSDAGNVAAGTP